MENMPEKGQKFGFDIVLKKKVQTYIEVESSSSPGILGETPQSPWGRPHRLGALPTSCRIFSQMKNNPNQICWLLEKVHRSSDTQNGFTTFQQFLDNQQYTNRGILRYEKMFGAGYVSTGGPSTTKVAIGSQDTEIKKMWPFSLL